MGNPLSTHTEASTKLITAHQAHHCDDHARSQSRDKVSLPKHRAQLQLAMEVSQAEQEEEAQLQLAMEISARVADEGVSRGAGTS